MSKLSACHAQDQHSVQVQYSATLMVSSHMCCPVACADPDLLAGENSGEAQAAAEAAQEASRKAAIAAGLLPEGAAGGSAEDVEAARVRRLKAQGRFMPY